jgi:hypothetical protein
MDPDLNPDPSIFVINLQDASKKLIIFKFFCLLFFQRYKVKKKSQNSSYQGFSYYFSLMIKGRKESRKAFNVLSAVVWICIDKR